MQRSARLPFVGALGLTPAFLIVAALVVAPTLFLVRYSFNQYDPFELMITAFTFENYVKFFATPYFQNVMLSTIRISLECTVAALLLGYPVALMLARTRSRFKSLLIIIVLFPLLVGNVVRAAGWMTLLGTQGFINVALMKLGLIDAPIEMMYTHGAVFIGMLGVILPFMILTLQGVLENVDFELVEAAQNLGASKRQAFLKIILPLSLPGVTTGAVLVFILCMNAYSPHAVMNALSTHHLKFAKAREALWIENIDIYCEFPLEAEDKRSSATFAELLNQAISATGLSGKKIGMDSGPGWAAGIEATFPGTELRALVGPAREMRFVKHDEELELMRAISNLSDWMQERYAEEIRPGRLVSDLDMTVARLGYEKAAEMFPAQDIHIFIYTLSGPCSASPHGDGAQAGARIENGHGMVNVIIPRLNGVTTENERTFFCGQPNDLQRKAYEASLAANIASIEQMVAGNSVRDIDAAARAVYAKAGFAENVMHRTGHGVGLLGHDYPDDMPFLDRPLLEKEVYSAEPGIYLFGTGGFRIDDTVIVGADRPEVMTLYPKGLDDVIVS